MSSLMLVDAGWVLAARALLVLVFARAVSGKVSHWHEFIGVVANYGVVRASWAPLTAVLVVIAETLITSSLLTGWLLSAGCGLAAMLLCGFAAAIGFNLARGRTDIDCGCFRSHLRRPLAPWLVARNFLLAGVACLPMLGEVSSFSGLELTTGFGAGVSFFLLYLVGEQLTAAQHRAALLRARWS